MKRIECVVQHYKWGKIGAASFVAKLRGGHSNANEHYAELWMGTHPNGASRLLDQPELSLLDHVKTSPEVLGTNEPGDLKFLFKVLSVGSALSVQVHPTKEQAKKLHTEDPANYPDDNHKPEMAIALSPFELLCGFRPSQEIVSNVKAHRELLELIDETEMDRLADVHAPEESRAQALRAIFTQVWTSPNGKITQVVAEITQRLAKKADKAPVDDLMLRLNEQFPGGDVGVLAPLFLNYFTLTPGQATFLSPNEPHAYISGDCIECMACSDNTVRAGLTPKYKDVSTLCNILTYRMIEPPYLEPTKMSEGVTEYAPPVSEFAVQKIDYQATSLAPLSSSSIIIVISGESTLALENGTHESLRQGTVIFLPKSTKAQLQNSSTDFLCFRAYSPN